MPRDVLLAYQLACIVSKWTKQAIQALIRNVYLSCDAQWADQLTNFTADWSTEMNRMLMKNIYVPCDVWWACQFRSFIFKWAKEVKRTLMTNIHFPYNVTRAEQVTSFVFKRTREWAEQYCEIFICHGMIDWVTNSQILLTTKKRLEQNNIEKYSFALRWSISWRTRTFCFQLCKSSEHNLRSKYSFNWPCSMSWSTRTFCFYKWAKNVNMTIISHFRFPCDVRLVKQLTSFGFKYARIDECHPWQKITNVPCDIQWVTLLKSFASKWTKKVNQTLFRNIHTSLIFDEISNPHALYPRKQMRWTKYWCKVFIYRTMLI
jgi:hypothetical protein